MMKVNLLSKFLSVISSNSYAISTKMISLYLCVLEDSCDNKCYSFKLASVVIQ